MSKKSLRHVTNICYLKALNRNKMPLESGAFYQAAFELPKRYPQKLARVAFK